MFVSSPTYAKNYILNISQVSEYELPYAGERALNLSNLTRIGAPIPTGFVIASKAFDDFLFANNLIEKINEVNKHVYQGTLGTKKAEAMIKRMMIGGRYPKLMQESLLRAYNLLANGNKISIRMDLSSINPELKDSLKSNHENILLSDDFDEFLEKLKIAWIELFTKEALDHRLNSKYKGVLSVAVVTTKYIQPEISGRSYTMSIENANPDFVESRVVYGLSPEAFFYHKFPDRYLVDKKTEQIVVKALNKQDWMYLRKNGKISKVQLDIKRQKNPKLTDIEILKLSRTIEKLKESFNNELKIDWFYSSGKVYFSDMSRLREDDVLQARKLLVEQVPIKATQNAIPLNQERFELQSIDKLTKLTQGEGNNKGLVYGRARLIRNITDLDNAKAVDILIMNKLPKRFDLSNVHYRGLVLEDMVKHNITHIPTLTATKDVTNLVLDNEVITIDTDSGIIYLGAGFRAVTKKESPQITESITPNTVNTKQINVTVQSPLTHGLFKTNLVGKPITESWLPEERQEITTEMKDDPVHEKSKERNINMTDEWYLKSPVFVDEEITESSCEYLQTVNVENPKILNNTNGVYFKISAILKSLDIDKYELVRNSHMKRKFIDFLEGYFVQYSNTEKIVILLDVVENAKQLLAESEVLEFQLDLIKRLKYKTELKNVSITFPDVRTGDELSLLKKNAVSSGIRRSSTFKIYVEIASPLAGISVSKIADEGVDSIVIDLEKLNENLGCENTRKLSNEVLEFVSEIIKKVKKTTVPAYVCADKISLNDDDIETFIESGIVRFVFPEAKITQLSPILENIEIKSLKTSKTVRGRKKKDINYGF
jgi:phosphoenolpyruvate synthase/pyruvate phosphate dikinase